MTPARVAAAVVVVAAEALVVRTYVDRGTSWHLLLHTPIGLGLGLAAGAAWSVARRRPTRAWTWALAGQLVSITPDLLFVLARLPHARWMDAFVGHVQVHLAQAPLLVALAVLLLGGWSFLLADAGRRAGSAGLATLTVGVLALALVTADPLPTSVAELRPVSPAATGTWADPTLWCGD